MTNGAARQFINLNLLFCRNTCTGFLTQPLNSTAIFKQFLHKSLIWSARGNYMKEEKIQGKTTSMAASTA